MKVFKLTHRIDLDEFFTYLDESKTSVRTVCKVIKISLASYDDLKKRNGCMSRKLYNKFVSALPFLHYYEIEKDERIKRYYPSNREH